MAGILSLFTKSRGALFMSALVLPGSGQFFVQKRYAAGLFYGFFCGLTALWFLVCAMWEIVVFYGMADFSRETPPHPGWKQIVLSFAAAMFCMGLNLLDVWLANRQIERREKAARLAELAKVGQSAEHPTSNTERRTDRPDGKS